MLNRFILLDLLKNFSGMHQRHVDLKSCDIAQVFTCLVWPYLINSICILIFTS